MHFPVFHTVYKLQQFSVISPHTGGGKQCVCVCVKLSASHCPTFTVRWYQYTTIIWDDKLQKHKRQKQTIWYSTGSFKFPRSSNVTTLWGSFSIRLLSSGLWPAAYNVKILDLLGLFGEKHENEWEWVKPAVMFLCWGFPAILLLALALSDISACLHWKWLCNIAKCKRVKPLRTDDCASLGLCQTVVPTNNSLYPHQHTGDETQATPFWPITGLGF